jgi:hypothetical protein
MQDASDQHQHRRPNPNHSDAPERHVCRIGTARQSNGLFVNTTYQGTGQEVLFGHRLFKFVLSTILVRDEPAVPPAGNDAQSARVYGIDAERRLDDCAIKGR